MSLPRKTLTILAAAIPTLIVIAWALWVLREAFAIREAFGTWHLTVRDANGAEAGHGALTIDAHGWGPLINGTPPWLHLRPVYWDDTGEITFTAAAVQRIATTDHIPWTGPSASMGALLPISAANILVMVDLPGHHSVVFNVPRDGLPVRSR